VDTDTQGQAASALGLTPEAGLFELATGDAQPQDVLIEARENLYLLAGGQSLARLKRSIAQAEFEGEYALANALEPLIAYFDYVILDTAPSWDVLNVNVLFFARELLCPVSLEMLAVQGLLDFMGRVSAIGKRSGSKIKYILPTALDRRVAQTEEIYNQLHDRFNGLLCAPIRYNVRLSEAPAHGQHIFEYSPTSNGAHDYRALTERILRDE
jgi:chromosome partitioning protein